MPPLLITVLLDWRTWAFVAVIAASTWLYHSGVTNERNKWTAAMASQKLEAAKLLSEATARVKATDDRNRNLATQLEVDNANAQVSGDKALADNRMLAARLGGLRDPGYRPGCGSTLPSAASAAAVDPGADRGAVLSDQAQEFLFEFARSADRTRDQLATCQAWVKGIGGVVAVPMPP